MPQYKLIYFNMRVRAEVSRLLFAYAGVEYEDHRIPFDEEGYFKCAEWLELKPKTPFSRVPVLMVGDECLGQSRAIERYLAKEFGLSGQTRLEQARVDSLVATMDDLIEPMCSYYFETRQDNKIHLKKKFFSDLGPEMMDKFEDHLTKSTSGLLVGQTVTWADLALFHLESWLTTTYAAEALKLIDKYPKFKEHHDTIAALPKIAEWLKRRPQTAF